VEINLTLGLPRDEGSITVARHICGNALAEVGATPDCLHDIEVALSEACTNVLKHAGPTDDYGVALTIRDETCTIEVTDDGRGFDVDEIPDSHPVDASAEDGRGVQLMRALVDRVLFTSRPAVGTVVHLEKTLDLLPDALITRLKG
jgi:serine/threonine-protein kinase RsbW